VFLKKVERKSKIAFPFGITEFVGVSVASQRELDAKREEVNYDVTYIGKER